MNSQTTAVVKEVVILLFSVHFQLKYVLWEGKGFKLNLLIMRVTYLTKVGGYKNSNLKEIFSFY